MQKLDGKHQKKQLEKLKIITLKTGKSKQRKDRSGLLRKIVGLFDSRIMH